MDTIWLAYLVGAIVFGAAAVLSGNVTRGTFILTLLTLQANVGLTIGDWRPPLYVGNSGATGFAIPLIGFAALVFFLCRRSLDRRPMRFVSERLTGPAALLFFATALTILYTPERRLALYQLPVIVYGYIICLVPLNYVRSKADVRLAVNLLMLTLAIQSLVYYVQHYLGVTFSMTGEVLVRDYSGFKRHGGTVSHSPTGFAIFVSPLILIGVSRFMTTTNRRVKFWSAAVSVMGLIALALNRTRAAWIGVVLGCVWMVFLGLRRHAIQRRRLVMLIASGLAILIVLTPVIVGRFSVDNAADYEERARLMSQAWRIIQHNPVLGVGAGAYGTVLRHYVLPHEWSGWLYTVHNAYLLTWAETGLLGIVAFLLLLWNGLRQALICSRVADETVRALALGWGAGLVHIIWELWFDIGLGGSAPWLLWFMLGLLVASTRAVAVVPASAPSKVRVRRTLRGAWPCEVGAGATGVRLENGAAWRMSGRRVIS